MYEKLLFRRQFIVTDKENKLDGWEETSLFADIKLYNHPDLQKIDLTIDNKRAILLGYILDPYHIDYTDYDILENILANADNFEEFQKNTLSLSGRWILFFITDKERKVFSDTATARHINYSTKGELIIGSNPMIINYYIPHAKNTDPLYLEYMDSRFYKINEGEFYLDMTGFEDIFKLIPNHYFDLGANHPQRFWIESEYIDYDHSIAKACELMVNAFKALDKRDYYKVQSLTAGYDSRVVYAASSFANIDTSYYLSTMNSLGPDHPDLLIAEQILRDDGNELMIIDNLAELRDDFVKYYKGNIESAKILPKSLTVQHMLDSPDFPDNTMIITGNYSEIFKDYYRQREASSGAEIAKLVGIPKKYKIYDKPFDKWIEENRDLIKKAQINMMDLFFWEHRLPNFGIAFVANQDLAAEEFSVFNNRELFLSLIKAKHACLTNHTEIFKDIIEKLHPELMAYPINPRSGKGKIAALVKKNVSKRTWEYIKLALKK